MFFPFSGNTSYAIEALFSKAHTSSFKWRKLVAYKPMHFPSIDFKSFIFQTVSADDIAKPGLNNIHQIS